MKSRWTTYLLLAAAAAVWGVVAWKIFVPVDDAIPAAHAKPVTQIADRSATDTLRLGYADPFLRSDGQPHPAVRPLVRTVPAVKRAAPERSGVRLVHLGTVCSAGRQLCILTIGDVQCELARGEEVEGFVLVSWDQDSLYLRRDGVTYGVKNCEP